MTLKYQVTYDKQECIPVGCVPSAVAVVSARGGGAWSRGGASPRESGSSSGGGSSQEGVLPPRGVLPPMGDVVVPGGAWSGGGMLILLEGNGGIPAGSKIRQYPPCEQNDRFSM